MVARPVLVAPVQTVLVQTALVHGALVHGALSCRAVFRGAVFHGALFHGALFYGALFYGVVGCLAGLGSAGGVARGGDLAAADPPAANGAAAAAAAAEAETPRRRLAEQIDAWIARDWQARKLQPAAVAGDEEFVRRLYLDLAGRIPTPEEYRDFCGQTGPDKRAALIDRLVASPEFAAHFADQLHGHLLGRTRFPAPEAWIGWLRANVDRGASWQSLCRELVLARPATDDRGPHGPSEFLVQRLAASEPLDAVTRDVTRLLFGVDMQCARCHAHPAVAEWEPASYWGMAAFFHRSYVVEIEGRKFAAERSRGEAQYTPAGSTEPRQASPQFMTGAVPATQPEADAASPARIAARKEAFPEADEGSPLWDDPEEYWSPPAEQPLAPARPKYSRREALADMALRNDNPYFVRAIVNRVWAWLLGRGLIEPLDQLHEANPPTHPELLDALSAAFVEAQYDLRPLVREIVSSRTYQLASVRPTADADAPSDAYVQGRLKPLSARQFAAALLLAVGRFEGAPHDAREAWHAEELDAWTLRFDAGSDQFQPSLPLAMFVANSREFARLVRDSPLACRLSATPSAEAGVQAAFESVLSRRPDADELAACRTLVESRPGRRDAAWEHLVWSLLASSEFRFNH